MAIGKRRHTNDHSSEKLHRNQTRFVSIAFTCTMNKRFSVTETVARDIRKSVPFRGSDEMRQVHVVTNLTNTLLMSSSTQV